MSMGARAIFHLAPHTVAVRETETPPLQPGELRVRSQTSAISPGTESLIFRGGMPENWVLGDGTSACAGEFRYPFKFGSALVAQVVEAGGREDRDWVGQRVFVRHCHQDSAVVRQADCRRVPEEMPVDRALFLGNMETALALVLDAAPLAGERVMVFGQGVIGLLTTAILAHFPLAELITSDPVAARREQSMELGAALAIDPAKGRELAVLEDCLFFGNHNGLDIAIEVSGQIEALNQAIKLTGFDGRIVVGSWYGRNAGPVDLGGYFHERRQRLVSSRANSPNPRLSGRWNEERRLKLALEWLDRIRPERFITHRFAPEACQEAFELAADKRAGAMLVIFEYP